MIVGNGRSAKLSGHNIKCVKDADRERMQNYVTWKAREWFERDAYAPFPWYRGADQKESGSDE